LEELEAKLAKETALVAQLQKEIAAKDEEFKKVAAKEELLRKKIGEGGTKIATLESELATTNDLVRP